jgi:hypothetical protein
MFEELEAIREALDVLQYHIDAGNLTPHPSDPLPAEPVTLPQWAASINSMRDSSIRE